MSNICLHGQDDGSYASKNLELHKKQSKVKFFLIVGDSLFFVFFEQKHLNGSKIKKATAISQLCKFELASHTCGIRWGSSETSGIACEEYSNICELYYVWGANYQ